MEFRILLANSQEEKEAVYRFRYRVFIEELNKYHVEADHERKLLYDDADEFATIYYINDETDKVIATVRAIGGSESIFPKYAKDFFDLALFEQYFEQREYALSDRIMVDPSHRSQKIGDKLHQASFIKGLEWGTQICFCSCDETVLLMYLHYGWRPYADPEILPNGKKRFKLLLLLTDKEYLKKLNSPYLNYIPENVDCNIDYRRKLQDELGISLGSLIF